MNALSRSLTMWLITTLAPANIHAVPVLDAEHRPVLVVEVHNYAAIPPAILQRATQAVSRAFDGLGVDVRWVSPLRPSDVPSDDLQTQLVATVHFRMFGRDGKNQALRGVIGIDAPTDTGHLITVAHVLYEPVGDQSISGLALAHVMAHLVARIAVWRDGAHGATIIRAGREEARRLARGESPFTPEEAEAIRNVAALLVEREDHSPVR